MIHSKTETLIGAIVLCVALGFLTYILAATNSFNPHYGITLKASFRSANGVSVGSDVRIAGVSIGKVTELKLDPQSLRADIIVSLQEALSIPDDSGIAINQDGLLGESYIEILPGGSEFNMANGDYFIDTQGSISLLSLLLKFITSNK